MPRIPMLMVREFLKNKYYLVFYIGLENSPPCRIHWGKHRINKYQMGSPIPVNHPDPNVPVLMEIMAEILSEEFGAERIKVSFLEFPTKSQPDSRKRNKFR